MSVQTRSKLLNLELVRGLSALSVCLFHVRHLMFGKWGERGGASVPWRLFFMSTSFGHQAVMIFFVLSGYLITKSLLQQRARGQEVVWRTYAWRRFSRLWIVLIPALLLTALLDWIGRSYVQSDFYSGALGPLQVPATYNLALSSYSPLTFICNTLFLQTILAPTFGTDGPLWSLCNEAVYYFLFPFIFIALSRDSTLWTRGWSCVVLIASCFIIPANILLYGLVWLMGLAAVVVQARVVWSKRWLSVTLLGSGMLFFVVLFGEKLSSKTGFLPDFLLGAVFTVFLVPLASAKPAPNACFTVGNALSDISYTLYLVHLPFLGLVLSLAAKWHKPGLDLATASEFLLIVAVVLLYAALVYYFTERHTASIQRSLPRILNWRRASEAALN